MVGPFTVICTPGVIATGMQMILLIMMTTRTEPGSSLTKVPVCPEEHFTLTCQTNLDQILTWDVNVPYSSMFYTILTANEGVRDVQTVQIDSTVILTFDCISESLSNILPLVSQLSINNLTGHLNGTTINCTEHSIGNIILQREIHIIDIANSKQHVYNIISYYNYNNNCIPRTGHLHSPQVTWRTENYNTRNVVIIVEWMQELIGATNYNINVTPAPLAPAMDLSGNTSRLILLYNTSYSVTVVSILCGQKISMTVVDIIINQSGESVIITSSKHND